MADFNSLAEMLDQLRQKVAPDLQPQVEEIMDALGRLQVEVGQQEDRRRPRRLSSRQRNP